MPRKKTSLPAVTWIEWMRDAVSNLGNNWCGGPSQEYHDQAARALQEAEQVYAASSPQTPPAPRLFETDHPYYCSDENADANEPGTRYDSWEDFLGDFGSSDMDYNLVFRWDWKPREADWKEDHFEGEPEPPEHVLEIFIMRQRKGSFLPVSVTVTLEDEPAVRAWLEPRWEHLRAVWSGFSGQPGKAGESIV